MDILSCFLLSSMFAIVIARYDVIGHATEEHTIVMNSTYCSGKGYNDAEEVQLTNENSWHVTWSGYGIGEDDFCGVSFRRSKEDITDTDERKLCITSEIFNVTDCGVTLEYYAIEKVFSGKPSQIYNCTYSPKSPFCTTKPIVRIIVESIRDSTSHFHLHIESPQNNSGISRPQSSIQFVTILGLAMMIFIF